MFGSADCRIVKLKLCERKGRTWTTTCCACERIAAVEALPAGPSAVAAHLVTECRISLEQPLRITSGEAQGHRALAENSTAGALQEVPVQLLCVQGQQICPTVSKLHT